MAAAAAKIKPQQETAKASVTVERDALTNAMSVIASVVKPTVTIPILSHVLLTAEGDTLSLRGTDLDIQATTQIPAQCDAPFSVAVNAHRFFEMAKATTPGAQIRIEHDGARVLIYAGRSRWTIHSLPAADFPQIAIGELPHQFTCTGKLLAGLFTRARAFQVAGSEAQVRAYLAGTFLHAVDDKAVFAATNGHGLGRSKTAIALSGSCDIIVPTNLGNLLASIGKEISSEIDVQFSDRMLHCQFGSLSIAGKLIDGNYPDYSRVIPKANDKPVTFEAAAMRAAIKRVILVATEKTRTVRFDFDAGKVTLSATSPDVGTASEELPCDYSSDPVSIGFNAAYFADMLDCVGSENVTVTLADSGSPTLFTETPHGDFVGVLMPMRI
jgi:DNA polymerase-3 subunit beta